MRVLERLGIRAAVTSRLRAFPNGASAMAALARVPGTGAIGCTQVTEILYTPGVALVAPLPGELDLATVYVAAVTTSATDSALARQFVAWLCGERSADLRRDGGFALAQSRS
jgi:molybdate transport system substrate-binding protein